MEKVLIMIAKNPASHSTPLTNIRVPRISNKKKFITKTKEGRQRDERKGERQERKVNDDEIANDIRDDE